MKLALVIAVALCGCKKVSKEECTKRVAALETRLHDEQLQIEALAAIGARLDEESRPTLPVATNPENHFDPGFAMWLDPKDDPAAFERVIADQACIKRSDPLRIYIVGNAAGGAELDRVVAERAAWAAAASASWKVPIEVRRVVRLEKEAELFPWPEHSDSAQKLAKEVFAVKYEPNMDKLKARITVVNAGCDAIGKHAVKEGPPGDHVLALARGLRDCGCSVPNLDESIGTWHLMNMVTTELRWQKIAASTTTRPVAPLSCGKPALTTILRRTDAWTTPPSELDKIVDDARGLLEGCRIRAPLDAGQVASIMLTPGIGGTGINVSIDGDDAFMQLQECTRQASLETPAPVDGSTKIEIYVPAGRPE